MSVRVRTSGAKMKVDEVVSAALARRDVGPAELCEALLDEGVAPCVAAGFGVRRADGTWASSFAQAARRAESGRPAGEGIPRTAESPQLPWFFDIASVTKPMTASAMVLAGMDLTLPLEAFAPELTGTFAGPLPVELFLAHRAGLDAHRPLYAPLAEGRVDALDVARALHEVAQARRPDVRVPLPPEGAPPIYSDLGFLLAGHALARHSSAARRSSNDGALIDAGEVVTRLVATALDLREQLGTARALEATEMDFSGRVVPTEVVAFRGGEVRGVVHDENAWAITGRGGSGHAGMFGTIGAVLSFGQAVHDVVVWGAGPFARRADAKDAFSALVRVRPGGTLLAGFDGKSPQGSSAGTLHGPRTFGHLGFTGTSLWIDPDRGIVTSLLTNRVHPTRDNVGIRAARPRAHDALFAMAEACGELASPS